MVQFDAPSVGDIPIFLTLLLLELILSFDNAAILAALANRLPREQRRKALLYGLIGAYVFRVLAIVFVVVILANPWLKLVGAGYLIFLAVKHFAAGGHGSAHEVKKTPKVLWLSPLWSVIVYIELADIAFALDQIVVAVGLVGDDVTVIIIAALIAIIFLRIAAFYIAQIMEWFPPLESLAYAAVGFVGVKLVLAHEFAFAPWLHVEIPTAISVAVTFSLIVLPPLAKALWDKAHGRRLLRRSEEDIVPPEATEEGGLHEAAKKE